MTIFSKKIALSILATCALVSFQPAHSQVVPPPLKIGRAYSTEFAMSTMTFTVLESLNRNRIEARIHKGHNAEQELGSVVWLNLSMLKIIAEAQLDGSGNRQAEGGADQLATAPESKPESDAKPKSKSEKPAR